MVARHRARRGGTGLITGKRFVARNWLGYETDKLDGANHDIQGGGRDELRLHQHAVSGTGQAGHHQQRRKRQRDGSRTTTSHMPSSVVCVRMVARHAVDIIRGCVMEGWNENNRELTAAPQTSCFDLSAQVYT